MRKAYMFHDINQFSDFVRIYGAKSTSARGYTLYRVRHPEHPAKDTLLLFGFRKPNKLWSIDDIDIHAQEVQIEEKDDQLVQKRKGEDNIVFEILYRQHTDTLLEQIQLRPWRDEPESLRELLFWLHDPQQMPWLVTTSLKLNNDRIQYATIEQDEAKHIILRIETPSYYLIQWCEEQHTSKLDLYYPLIDGTFIEWGHNHPLADLWRRAQSNRHDEWTFFRADGTRQHMPPLKWEDVYQTTEFSLDFPAQSVWSQESDEKPRIPVSLRLEHRGRPLDPELWLLEEDEQHHLEQLLSMVDEEDLKTLLISVQKDEQGRKRFIIREKHMGEGRQYLDFGGKQFATYKGFYNLFLPIQYELQPQLRRDQYRKIFSLQNGQFTVLVPPPGGPETWDGKLESAELLTFKENSFEPMLKLIDYLMNSESEHLTSLLKKSVFDFGAYAKAPSRPDLREKKDKEKKEDESKAPKKPEKAAKPNEDESAGVEVKKTVVKKRRKQQEAENVKIEVAPTELEVQEADLERKLISKGQQMQTWSMLLDTKALLKKWSEATDCAFEALWLAAHQETPADIHEQLRGLLDRQLDIKGTPGKRLAKAEQLARKEQEPIAVISYILHGQQESEDRINTWLQTSSELLRGVEQKMRKKTRWLMWRELLRRNGDVREQARIKESILGELNQQGLAPYDVPHFIQNRLFQERWLQPDDEDSSGEIGAAHGNLDMMKNSVDAFPVAHLRYISYAILARAYSRIGYHAQAHKLLEEALSNAKKEEDYVQAWIYLYSIQAIQVESKNESRVYRQQFQTLLKQMEKSRSSHLTTLKAVEETLKARVELDNPAEFLSKENFKRFYPVNASPASEETQQIMQRLTTAFQNGLRDQLMPNVEAALDHASRELNEKKHTDYRGLSWLLHSMVEIISKMRAGADGRKLIQRFEDFVRDLPTTPPENKMNAFYFQLLRLSLSQGLLELGNELMANNILQQTLHWTNQETDHLVSLDFIDMCSSALKIIESAQLHNRRDSLQILMQGMIAQMNGPYKNTYHEHSFSSFVLKLIDQAIEATLSKEKLTLGLYKQYMDQDELLIRERILHEDVCLLAKSSS